MLIKSTEQLLVEIGEQLRTKRIAKNLTQSELAKKAGLSRRTVQAIERGESIALLNLIEMLRILDLLDVFATFVDKAEISPLMIAKSKGNVRQRARKSHQHTQEDEYQW